MNRTETTIAPTRDYRDWHLSLARGDITLAKARADLAGVGAQAGEIPLLVQLVENPKFRVPGIDLFHGRVELGQHDAIHILLGRGLLNKDEAFTIGFTMGSTHNVSTIEEQMFATIASSLYPKPYRFNGDDIAVFSDALRLAWICGCQPLDMIDFSQYDNTPLAEVRSELGIDKKLLLAYYRLEKRRFPNCPASQRLLNGWKQL